VTWTTAYAKRLEGTRLTWHRRCLWQTQEPETLETLVAGESRTDFQTHLQSINTSMFSVCLIDYNFNQGDGLTVSKIILCRWYRTRDSRG